MGSGKQIGLGHVKNKRKRRVAPTKAADIVGAIRKTQVEAKKAAEVQAHDRFLQDFDQRPRNKKTRAERKREFMKRLYDKDMPYLEEGDADLLGIEDFPEPKWAKVLDEDDPKAWKTKPKITIRAELAELIDVMPGQEIQFYEDQKDSFIVLALDVCRFSKSDKICLKYKKRGSGTAIEERYFDEDALVYALHEYVEGD